MFINCRHCHALVATDPATDLPPERCPRCAGVLRRAEAAAVAPVPTAAGQDDLASAVASAVAAVAAVAPTDDPFPPETRTGRDGSREPGSDSPSAAKEAPDPGDADGAPDPGAASGRAAAPSAAPPPADAVEAGSGPGPRPADPDPGATPSPSGDAAVGSRGSDTPVAPSEDTATEPKATEPGLGFLSGKAPATTGPGRTRPGWRAFAIAALALLLGLQVLLADRARLAADARWRPLVAATCGVFGCSLPPWREPSALVLVAREVRPHPDVPGALRVRATFRNDARWPQAWPSLLLTLSDVEGRAVAARVFRADEYRGAGTSAPIAPGQTADIALDIREPSVATVSFAFDFGQ